jgi:hypothetical protein
LKWSKMLKKDRSSAHLGARQLELNAARALPNVFTRTVVSVDGASILRLGWRAKSRSTLGLGHTRPWLFDFAARKVRVVVVLYDIFGVSFHDGGEAYKYPFKLGRW